MKITSDTPLNPECPAVMAFKKSLRGHGYIKRGDYWKIKSGRWEEWLEDFEKIHKLKCEKCKKYSVGSISVKSPPIGRKKQGWILNLLKS